MYFFISKIYSQVNQTIWWKCACLQTLKTVQKTTSTRHQFVFDTLTCQEDGHHFPWLFSHFPSKSFFLDQPRLTVLSWLITKTWRRRFQPTLKKEAALKAPKKDFAETEEAALTAAFVLTRTLQQIDALLLKQCHTGTGLQNAQLSCWPTTTNRQFLKTATVNLLLRHWLWECLNLE